jgi:hypothetical protein
VTYSAQLPVTRLFFGTGLPGIRRRLSKLNGGAAGRCALSAPMQDVPVAVIAAWIGHKDASLSMKLYAHSQDDALQAAGDTGGW